MDEVTLSVTFALYYTRGTFIFSFGHVKTLQS